MTKPKDDPAHWRVSQKKPAGIVLESSKSDQTIPESSQSLLLLRRNTWPLILDRIAYAMSVVTAIAMMQTSAKVGRPDHAVAGWPSLKYPTPARPAGALLLLELVDLAERDFRARAGTRRLLL